MITLIVFSTCMVVMIWWNLTKLKETRQRERAPFLTATGIALALGYGHLAAGFDLAGFHHLLTWMFGGLGDWLFMLQRSPFFG